MRSNDEYPQIRGQNRRSELEGLIMKTMFALAAVATVAATTPSLSDYATARSSVSQVLLTEASGPTQGGKDTAQFAEANGSSPDGRDTAMA